MLFLGWGGGFPGAVPARWLPPRGLWKRPLWLSEHSLARRTDGFPFYVGGGSACAAPDLRP